MTPVTSARPLPLFEFIALLALVTALDALSTDAMLPALPAMATDLGVAGGNDIQLVVATLFAGISLGQLLGGPLADAWGRKPSVYAGLALYIAGSAIGMLAGNFPVLLAARFLQGIGASIPLVAMNALVRDLYEGAPMARIMSFSGTIFILVPILAPLAGQGVLLFASWRMIFAMFLILSVPVSLWFALRQRETLPPSMRAPLSFSHIWAATREVVSIRAARGYILADGFLMGAFLGYLNSAQQIFQDTYGQGRYFPFYFSSLAFSIGLSLLVNGMLVERLGIRPLCYGALAAMAGLAILFLPVVVWFGGAPPLWMTMAYLVLTFLAVGVLFGNINALAMEPLGHIAGIGASVLGFTVTLIGIPIGTMIGQAYDGGITPLVSGFAFLCSLAVAAMYRGEMKRD